MPSSRSNLHIEAPIVDISRVFNWLKGHPDHPKDYHSEKLSIVRCKETYQHALRPRKTSGNIMDRDKSSPRQAPPQKASEKPAVDKLSNPKTISPRKARLPAPARSPLTSPIHRDSSSVYQDQYIIPRPQSLSAVPRLEAAFSSFDLLRPLPAPADLLAADSPTRSTTSDATTGLKSTSNTNPRSRCPTKRMGDLQLTDAQIEMKAIGTPGYPIPAGAKDLYRDLRMISNGKAVVPGAVKSTVNTIIDNLFMDDTNFSVGTEEPEQNTVANGCLSHESFWERVLEVLDAAMECENKRSSESEWNSEVHSTLLRLALRGWWKVKGVWYCDVTTAKIHDLSLLPTTASGSATNTEMIDYALVIDPSRELHQQIIFRLRAEGKGSINHTMAEYVRFLPIAVSIETKRAAVDEDDAHMQLGTWVSAHFARLRQLAKGSASLPVLPLLVVQGHNWILMIAEAMADHRVVILKDLELGRTNSVLGIYQVVTAVRRLAKWVDEEYKPWFAKEVLGGDLKGDSVENLP